MAKVSWLDVAEALLPDPGRDSSNSEPSSAANGRAAAINGGSAVKPRLPSCRRSTNSSNGGLGMWRWFLTGLTAWLVQGRLSLSPEPLVVQSPTEAEAEVGMHVDEAVDSALTSAACSLRCSREELSVAIADWDVPMVSSCLNLDWVQRKVERDEVSVEEMRPAMADARRRLDVYGAAVAREHANGWLAWQATLERLRVHALSGNAALIAMPLGDRGVYSGIAETVRQWLVRLGYLSSSIKEVSKLDALFCREWPPNFGGVGELAPVIVWLFSHDDLGLEAIPPGAVVLQLEQYWEPVRGGQTLFYPDLHAAEQKRGRERLARAVADAKDCTGASSGSSEAVGGAELPWHPLASLQTGCRNMILDFALANVRAMPPTVERCAIPMLATLQIPRFIARSVQMGGPPGGADSWGERGWGALTEAEYAREWAARDLDVVFYGMVTHRRRELLMEVSLVSGIRVAVAQGVHGEDLRNLLRRAKLLVNLRKSGPTAALTLSGACGTHAKRSAAAALGPQILPLVERIVPRSLAEPPESQDMSDAQSHRLMAGAVTCQPLATMELHRLSEAALDVGLIVTEDGDGSVAVLLGADVSAPVVVTPAHSIGTVVARLLANDTELRHRALAARRSWRALLGAVPDWLAGSL